MERYRLARPRKRDPRADRVALAALLLVGVGLPALLAVASGSLGIPHNDDFSYAKTALALNQTGTLAFDGWAGMTLVGQLVAVQPLLWLSGGATWAFGVFGLAASTLATVAGYLLARRLLGVGGSMAAVLAMVVVPGYWREASTFMTDIPALGFMLTCLLLCVIGLERGHDWRYLAASLVAGMLATSVREFALAATGAVLVVIWASERRRQRALIATVAAAAGNGAVILGAYALRGGVVPIANLVPQPFDPTIAIRMLFVIGTFLVPAIAFGLVSRPRIAAATAVASVAVAVVGHLAPATPLGDFLTEHGIADQIVLLGSRTAVFDPGVWTSIRWIGTVAAIALLLLLASPVVSWLARLRARWSSGVAELVRELVDATASPVGLLAVFVLLYGAGSTGYVVLVGEGFDRYAWPLAPVAMILLLVSAPARGWTQRWIPIATLSAGLAFLAVVSGMLALNSAAYDVARWRMGELAVSLGYAPSTIDAGFEWVGAHAAAPASLGRYTFAWYEQIWSMPRVCAVVSNAPVFDPRVTVLHVEVVAYRTYLFSGQEQPMYLYGANLPGCPPLQ